MSSAAEPVPLYSTLESRATSATETATRTTNIVANEPFFATKVLTNTRCREPSRHMALQICPKCQIKAFTWYVDEEVSPLTRWVCDGCGYVAEEDEALERDCSHCSGRRSSVVIRDDSGFHRWCSNCGAFESTTETFARQ